MTEQEIRWAENRVRREAFLAASGPPPETGGVREPATPVVPLVPAQRHLVLVRD